MKKQTQEEINNQAIEKINGFLNPKEMLDFLDSIRCSLYTYATQKKPLVWSFTYGDKSYTIAGRARKGDVNEGDFTIVCTDERALDVHVDCYWDKVADPEMGWIDDLTINHKINYHLLDHSRLIYTTGEGEDFWDITDPTRFLLKLEGPEKKNEIYLNGFLVPAGVSITPEGIKEGNTVVSHNQKRIVEEPKPKAIFTGSMYESIVKLNLNDINKINSSDEARAQRIKKEIIEKLIRQVETEIGKRVETRKKQVTQTLNRATQIMNKRFELETFIKHSVFTAEEIKMFENCMAGRDIRHGIATR